MDQQAVINNIEDNVDTVVESVVPEVAEAVTLVRNNPVLLVGVGLVALSAGVAIGYKVAQKRLQTKYDALLAEEVAAARDYYVVKEGDFATPESAAQTLGAVPAEVTEAMADYKGEGRRKLEVVEDDNGVRVQEVTESQVTVRNIFVDGEPIVDGDWDQDAEEADRDPSRPYIVSKEEYFENEPDHEQISVTYYEGDDVLTDDGEGIINNTDTTVGDENLKRFGHGSGEEHILYVRNEKSKMDFEVARSTGKYAVEVLGMSESELEETSPNRRRTRGGDE